MDSGNKNYPWQVIPITAGGVAGIVDALKRNGCTYGFGAKATPLDCSIDSIDEIDCSGFAKKAVYDLTQRRVVLPDGSMNQEAYFAEGYKATALEDVLNKDGVLRIGFLSARSYPKLNENHVFFVWHGMTFESCGSQGPCSRILSAREWWHYCRYFVVNPHA